MRPTAVGKISHRLARHALMSASALALTAILSTQPARAVDECGAEGPGTDTVTCTGASYANGITYAGSDGLSLVLNNSAMTVTQGAATDGVNLSGATSAGLTYGGQVSSRTTDQTARGTIRIAF